jgi:curved DNA-binding protein CbpA
VAKRDPHVVLEVSPGSSLSAIKAAWRRLARQHHPDLTGDDPAASRVATRQMAEINDAYEALRRAASERRSERDGWTDGREPDEATTTRRAGGPPRPKPTRPVTGRLDLSGNVRPRNATTSRPSARPPGHMPRRAPGPDREPPRASDPTGPLERGRVHRFRRPRAPNLDRARSHEIEFGKFRGHTLGQIADFEPSYVDWLSRTIMRDPDLMAAARVVVDDLDRRGIIRRGRPDRPSGQTA